jgi:guanine nucleotide exchange protein C9orf72
MKFHCVNTFQSKLRNFQIFRKNCFIPEIQVQGLIAKPKSKDVLKIIPIDSLLSSNYPISVIDLVNKKVWIFQLYNYFIPLKENYFSYYPQSSSKIRERNRQFRGNYQRLSAISPLVHQFLELALLKVDKRLRTAFVQEWMKLLMKRALLLIKYVEYERFYSLALNVSGEDLSKCINLKDLKENLELSNPIDLNVILAIAEKFKPGIYSLVEGDPQKEARNVIELFSDI